MGGPDVARCARVDAVLLVVRSVVGAGTVWLLPVSTRDQIAAAALFAAVALLAVMASLASWDRVPRGALAVFPALGMGSLALLGAVTTGIGPTYVGYFVFSFISVGLSGSARAVLVQLPVGAASWLLLNGAARSGIPADLAVRLVIAISLWATVGLLLARRTTEERRQRSRLAADAATDPLTGLGNRRALERCSPTCGSGMRSSSSM